MSEPYPKPLVSVTACRGLHLCAGHSLTIARSCFADVEKQRLRRMPNAATTKSWQLLPKQNALPQYELWTPLGCRVWSKMLSYSEKIFFRKMCGNHRDFLICQEEEKAFERLSLKRCMFRTLYVPAEVPEKHPHSWGGLWQRTLGKRANVNLLGDVPKGGGGWGGAWGGGGKVQNQEKYNGRFQAFMSWKFWNFMLDGGGRGRQAWTGFTPYFPSLGSYALDPLTLNKP